MAMPNAIFQECECKVTRPRENNHTCKPDLETFEIVTINLKREAQKAVIQNREHRSSCKAVVWEHVGHHAKFVMHRGIGPHEDAELFVDGPQTPPIFEGIENELIAA